MKVLKRKNKGWSKKVTCTGKGNGGGGCGSLLLVTRKDLYRTSHADISGDTEHYTTLCCSNCQIETDIEVPWAVSDKLPTKETWKRLKRERECNLGVVGADGSVGSLVDNH